MENITTINQRLRDFYGIFDDGNPNFRIVWSEDQYEMRYGEYDKITEAGLFLGKEVGFKYVPKYRQWMPNQYVLERNTGVPGNIKDLTTKTSYEPLWGFGEGKIVKWEPVKCLIDNLLEKLHDNKNKVKYPHPEDKMQTKEAIAERAKGLMELLFENDTISDALHYGDGVVMPHNVKDGEVVKEGNMETNMVTQETKS